MPNNLVFIGLHFVIGKRMYFLYDQLFSFSIDPFAVYANSLLVT